MKGLSLIFGCKKIVERRSRDQLNSEKTEHRSNSFHPILADHPSRQVDYEPLSLLADSRHSGHLETQAERNPPLATPQYLISFE